MQKTKVSMQFTSLTNLWEFRMAIDANIFEMNMAQLTITCDCTREHIELAIEKFKGKVVPTRKENDESTKPAFLHRNQ